MRTSRLSLALGVSFVLAFFIGGLFWLGSQVVETGFMALVFFGGMSMLLTP